MSGRYGAFQHQNLNYKLIIQLSKAPKSIIKVTFLYIYYVYLILLPRESILSNQIVTKVFSDVNILKNYFSEIKLLNSMHENVIHKNIIRK